MDQPESHSSLLRPLARPKWHLLYFVLAAFDLLTISASLYLNNQIMNLYSGSVRVNQEWADRLASYSRLREQGGAVNTPGNDVFFSHDIAAELTKLRRARQVFDEQIAAVRADLVQHLSEVAAVPLLSDLDMASTAMEQMTAEANRIFSAFAQDQPGEAGRHMAAMDRQYARLNAALSRLGQGVREIQQAHFQQQIVAAATLEKYEYAIASCLAVMVLGVAFYGQHLARSVALAQRESEQSAAALRRAHDELEMRVRERTVDLAKTNEALHAEVAERKHAEEQLKSSREQLRNLAAHLQSVREEERTRIAREIHDELGQSLTGLKMDISWLGRKLPDAAEVVHRSRLLEKIGSMNSLMDTTIQTVRKIATELRPSVLDTLGLTAAIEWQAQEFQARTGIACRLHLPVEEITLDSERATAVFRICQEILTNVARHAQATKVAISLSNHGRHLLLDVGDNGRGITEEEITNSTSLGLLGMQERAFLLKGTVRIRGIQGRGTTVTVRIPLDQAIKGVTAS